MPTYVYACKNCGHRFEQRQSFSDDALTVCPECHQAALHKVYNTVGIVFKGSGFYSTDSHTASTGPSSEKSSDSSSDDGSSSSRASSSDSGSSAGDAGSSSTSATTSTGGASSSSSSTSSSNGSGTKASTGA
ncbi:FmdB family zinc ribbon protein [Brachybacterium sp. AOP25-B2-12]|uniref:FmdB family zinc ribbon protein n=1 Tax=Brachybacterium sp. AOP25-B2-12 TaxID=3457710 RepID=UPI0040339FF8